MTKHIWRSHHVICEIFDGLSRCVFFSILSLIPLTPTESRNFDLSCENVERWFTICITIKYIPAFQWIPWKKKQFSNFPRAFAVFIFHLFALFSIFPTTKKKVNLFPLSFTLFSLRLWFAMLYYWLNSTSHDVIWFAWRSRNTPANIERWERET